MGTSPSPTSSLQASKMPKLSKLQRRLSRMVKVAKGSVTITRRRREGVHVEAAAAVVEGRTDRSLDSLDSSTSSDTSTSSTSSDTSTSCGVCREEVEEGDGYRIHLTTAHDSSYEEVEMLE